MQLWNSEAEVVLKVFITVLCQQILLTAVVNKGNTAANTRGSLMPNRLYMTSTNAPRRN